MSVQISLFLDDSGQLHAEAPSATGARRKIEISFSDNLTCDQIAELIRQNSFALAEELCAQQAAIAAKRKEQATTLAAERKKTILNYVAANHPAQLHLIDGSETWMSTQLRKKSNSTHILEAETIRASEIQL